jgi:hemoglobin-like flavoprotein
MERITKPNFHPMHAIASSDAALLQSSFRKISRDAENAADLFFTRLFDFSPSLRDALHTDLEDQKRGFMRLLGTIVHRSDSFELVRDRMRELALCRVDLCGNDDHHYAVGAALFWMLEQVLGDDFTAAAYASWMSVYRVLSADMKTAARELALAS